MGVQLESDSDSTLRAYCDSDWAGCQATRRSTGGFCTFLGSNLISWSAKRQDSVARSSTEAEYRTLSDTAAEVAWMSLMLKSIGVKQTTPAEIYCDNLSAVHLTANPVLHRKSKHFATHYHFAREKVADGSLIVKHIPSALQLADVFTKSLPQRNYFSLRAKLGVALSPTSSLRGGIRPTGSLTNKQMAHQATKPNTCSSVPPATDTKSQRQNRGTQQDKRTAGQVVFNNRFDAIADRGE